MDVIIGWQEHEFDLGGEKIKMELRPLKARGMMVLAPYLARANEEGTDPAGFTLELQEKALPILQEHTRNVRGLTVNGEPIKVENLTEETIFTSLVMDILGRLSSISVLTKANEKNFEKPSEILTTSGGSEKNPYSALTAENG